MWFTIILIFQQDMQVIQYIYNFWISFDVDNQLEQKSMMFYYIA
jgi:hypothetical protein